MNDFFKDIFDYHNHFNQKLVAVLSEHADKLIERSTHLFSHLINAHQIWNSRILLTKSIALNQLHSFEECKSIDASNYSDTLKILGDYDLNEVIQYKNSKGNEFQSSIQQILFHISNHSTHHKGQIISDLRQNGIEPIVTDYIFYKR